MLRSQLLTSEETTEAPSQVLEVQVNISEELEVAHDETPPPEVSITKLH